MSPAPRRRTRLFLDANVLVSAAWKSSSRVIRLWQIPRAALVTSNFVVVECQRNLALPEQHQRLSQLLRTVRVLTFPRPPSLQNMPPLAAKDQHVLAAAILARADFLVTGDRTHFGAWYGSRVLGVRVEPPASFPGVLEGI